MEYIVTMRNPESGDIERYRTDIAEPGNIPLIRDFWENGAGYEIISFETAQAPVSTADQSTDTRA